MLVYKIFIYELSMQSILFGSIFKLKVFNFRKNVNLIRDNYALGVDKIDNGPKVHKRCKIQLKGLLTFIIKL